MKKKKNPKKMSSIKVAVPQSVAFWFDL